MKLKNALFISFYSVCYIYIFIEIALDEIKIKTGKVSFLMFFISRENIKSPDQEATPMVVVKSKLASDIVCLLLLACRRSRIAMVLSAKVGRFGCSKIMFGQN